jgi:superfamily II DNA helicase RecQ
MYSGEDAARELNQFLASNRVLLLERQFVADGPRSAWAICVSYLDRGGRPASDREPTKRVDYREVLSAADFAVFAKLRSLRKALADQDGLPAYALFTNEQLATMVRQRTTTLKALEEIPGVGPARVQKHGVAFLEVLKASLAPPSTDATAKGESPATATP